MGLLERHVRAQHREATVERGLFTARRQVLGETPGAAHLDGPRFGIVGNRIDALVGGKNGSL